MDIEGAELEFFRSFDLSSIKIDLVIFETHVAEGMLSLDELEECHSCLKRYGFGLIEKSGKVEAWKRS